MKLISILSKVGKNKNIFFVCSYLDSKGKTRKIVLNHYDLEYAMKGKIKYEINKKSKK